MVEGGEEVDANWTLGSGIINEWGGGREGVRAKLVGYGDGSEGGGEMEREVCIHALCLGKEEAVDLSREGGLEGVVDTFNVVDEGGGEKSFGRNEVL